MFNRERVSMNKWATIILWEGSDPQNDRIIRESKSESLVIVFVPDAEVGAQVAADLVESGTELIELCGGFGLEAGARAVNGRAAVGAVSFGIDSITQAAAYKAKFDSMPG